MTQETPAESPDVKPPSSAPPVESSLLRKHKLAPLAEIAPSAKPIPMNEAPEASADDLSPDITEGVATDRAVDEITTEEADEVLAAEDQARQADNKPSHGLGTRLANFFSAWLGTKRGRHLTLLSLLVLIAVLGSVPKVRYWALNEAGVRSSLSLTVMDGSTDLPLPNVTVIDGSTQAKTNQAGMATLHYLKLGRQSIMLKRDGFARLSLQVTVGWGSNPLGNYTMKDVGQQYTILVRDYVSGNVIGSAKATTNGLETSSDKNGKITLTVDNPDNQPVPVTISATGYSPRSITLNGSTTTTTDVTLAPDQKAVFVTNQAGNYNLYASSVDGQNKQLLLAGTPTETSNIALAVSSDGSHVAFVSTRDANYDSNRTLLTGIALVNVGDGSAVTLDHALQIQLIGWAGTTIIYKEETTATPIPSYSIISYNYATNSRNQLATASQFSGVTIAGGIVYYALPAAASQTANGFYAVQPDGSHKQTILSQDVWTMLRTNYATLVLQTANGWYGFNIGGSSAATISAPSGNYTNRQYIDSPDATHSAWINTADSTAQLLVFNTSSNQDNAVRAPVGVTYPLRWLTNNDLMYRVTTIQGSADYVVSLSGGAPKEVGTVTNTGGIAGGL